MSFRELRESEETSTSGSDGLAGMFELSRSSTVNEDKLEIVEENPQAAWKLPSIDPSYVLCILRDLTHNKFTDSIIGGIVAPLSNGPVYFDCYPNFSVSVTDETLGIY
jgi:hypothetical protein